MSVFSSRILQLSEIPTIPGAGGSLEASTELSYLTSAFYPTPYFSNNKLAWVISAPKFSIITIEVMPTITVLISCISVSFDYGINCFILHCCPVMLGLGYDFRGNIHPC